MNRLKTFIVWLLKAAGYEIRVAANLKETDSLAGFGKLVKLLAGLSNASHLSINQFSEIVGKSKSQLGQDVLALGVSGIKRGGFFVEFGATDGVSLSNTYMLEKDFGWSGILCEPGKAWHSSLKASRFCSIDTRCVYSSSGQYLKFSETAIGELSTISKYKESDENRFMRKEHRSYDVETVSLEDLLATYNAPKYVDFLSVDTEGSELEILKDFNFDKYRFGLLVVEHNYTSNREKLHELLTRNGYKQIYPEHSKFDDWYLGPLD